MLTTFEAFTLAPALNIATKSKQTYYVGKPQRPVKTVSFFFLPSANTSYHRGHPGFQPRFHFICVSISEQTRISQDGMAEWIRTSALLPFSILGQISARVVDSILFIIDRQNSCRFSPWYMLVVLLFMSYTWMWNIDVEMEIGVDVEMEVGVDVEMEVGGRCWDGNWWMID